MKFDEIMDFGGAANRVTYERLRTAIKNGQVLPFIGAGLSKDAGYPLWTETIKRLSEFAEPSKQPLIKSLIESDLEKAADLIEASIGSRKMHDYLDDIFGEKDGLDARKLAVGILPYLFPSQLLMTTNFDRVIENAFHVTKSITIDRAIPSNIYNGSKMLAGTSSPSLYKIHGDVKSDYADIVFSKASYKQHYTGSTQVTQALQAVFLARHLLFIGCSLNKDRTLRLLHSLAKEGTTHFAILDEKADQIWPRRKELSDNYGIDAIIYPNGDYNCVKVILSRLLEEIDPAAFRTCLACHLPPDSSSNRFVYTSLNTDFIGRDEELQALLDFVKGDHRPVTWWALTGAGGSGKSRLVYEMKEKIDADMAGWQVITFNRSETITPDLLDRRVQAAGGNVVIIIDYMQTGLGHIAEWISSISTGSRNLRVLFLQRDGTKTLEEDILPSWLQEILSAIGNLNALLWKTELLTLETWTDPETIKKLMQSYAIHMKRKGELDEYLDELYKTLLAKDERLMLPLFAMFIADAKLEGNDPCQWDAEQLLNWFCTRERDMHGKQLRGISDKLDMCLPDYEALIVLSTIISSWKVQPAMEGAYLPYQNLIHTISETLHIKELQAIAKCVEWGILTPDETEKEFTFRSIQPDPFGEFFVLWYLSERLHSHGGKAIIEGLLQQVSQDIASGAEFFIRAFTDYGNFLEGKWLKLKDYLCSYNHWLDQAFDISVAQRIINLAVFTEKNDLNVSENAMARADTIAKNYKNNILANLFYAKGLVSLSSKQDAEQVAATIALLRSLTEQFPGDVEIALEYAKGLFNLSTVQHIIHGAATIVLLRSLTEQYHGDQEIALRYANSLFNLSFKQDADQGADTIALLRSLTDQYLGDREIALAYAKGLLNLSSKQDADHCAATIALLRSLTDQYPGDREIILTYAKGLLNLGSKQDADHCAATIALLRSLTDQYPGDREIILTYAKGLFNLSIVQEAGHCAATIALLRSLTEQYPGDGEIALEYAKGLFKLSIDQDADHGAATIALLRTLTEQYPGVGEIALRYAKGLVNLSYKQDADHGAATIALLRTLTEQCPGDGAISLVYAKGLINLSYKQDADQREVTTLLLRSLTEQYHGDGEIALAYAQGLVIQSREQDADHGAATIALLRSLTDQYLGDPEIILAYAKGLFNLSIVQEAGHCAATIALLRSLTEQYPRDEEIALEYAKGLFQLSIDQGADQGAATIALLRLLTEQYHGDVEIARQYAKGLVNLSNKQDAEQGANTIAPLCKLMEQYSDYEEFALYYSMGLVNLSEKQDVEDCSKTIKKLIIVSNQRSKNEEISLRVARGLDNLIEKQDELNRLVTLERLRLYAEEHSQNEEIANLYKATAQKYSST